MRKNGTQPYGGKHMTIDHPNYLKAQLLASQHDYQLTYKAEQQEWAVYFVSHGHKFEFCSEDPLVAVKKAYEVEQGHEMSKATEYGYELSYDNDAKLWNAETKTKCRRAIIKVSDACINKACETLHQVEWDIYS